MRRGDTTTLERRKPAKDCQATVQAIFIPPGQGHRIRAVHRPWVDAMINDAPLPATIQDGRVAAKMVFTPRPGHG